MTFGWLAARKYRLSRCFSLQDRLLRLSFGVRRPSDLVPPRNCCSFSLSVKFPQGLGKMSPLDSQHGVGFDVDCELDRK